ncbi:MULTISPECIES: hypothetical protein [Sedimenticola]|uniref:hypothetical protein n=1 Tax=Sedimenticola TaxID=349742 RepID=UPI00048DDD25|nr:MULTISPECIES: hypothetical protein [Sedimenticola]MCW8902083.1 hypothetical protein [Sedimenticola sp.]
MIIKDYGSVGTLPLYEVKELSMEEALLVLAADKESLRQRMRTAAVVPPRRFPWAVPITTGSAAA